MQSESDACNYILRKHKSISSNRTTLHSATRHINEVHQMHNLAYPHLSQSCTKANNQVLGLSLEGEPPCREVNVLLVLLLGDGGLLLGG